MNEVDRYMIRISIIYETGWIWGCHISQVEIFNGKKTMDFPEAISNLACIFQRLNGPQH
jgi:hypothetical protein